MKCGVNAKMILPIVNPAVETSNVVYLRRKEDNLYFTFAIIYNVPLFHGYCSVKTEYPIDTTGFGGF